MSKNKKALIRIAASVVMLGFGFTASLLKLEVFSVVLFVAAWLLSGFDVLLNAVTGVLHLQLLDENFLMAAATVGALFLREYPEAVAVMVFYQLGEIFQRYAVNKTRKSVEELSKLCPDSVNLLCEGKSEAVSPEEVSAGALILVKPGERVPLDGIVVSGEGQLDASALTGESLPRNVSEGSSVLSGCINLDGVLVLRVTKVFADSAVSKILELAESSAEKKSPAENFITGFARIYTPCVVIFALLLCIVPSLICGNFGFYLRKSLMLLMVSCPCALVVSVPLSFFGGIGAAAKRGILIKSSGYMEVISKATVAVFDKTGTLTKGEFTVTDILPHGNTSREFLISAAVAAEQNSSHPLAAGIRKLSENADEVSNAKELSGKGVECVYKGKSLIGGNLRLFEEKGVPLPVDLQENSAVHFGFDGEYIGSIILSDTLKEETKPTLLRLKKLGIKKCIMLTGDSVSAAGKTARKAGVDGFKAGLLPADKVAAIEALMAEYGNKNSRLLFVGDGINDAPVLARADVGFAMGGIGSDAAIEAADAVIANDSISRVADAVEISRKTLRIVKQNIVFSLLVKFAVLLAAVILPQMSMTLAIFADVGVMVLAVLNSLRALKFR